MTAPLRLASPRARPAPAYGLTVTSLAMHSSRARPPHVRDGPAAGQAAALRLWAHPADWLRWQADSAAWHQSPRAQRRLQDSQRAYMEAGMLGHQAIRPAVDACESSHAAVQRPWLKGFESPRAPGGEVVVLQPGAPGEHEVEREAGDWRPAGRGARRARSHGRFVRPILHFIPDFLTHSIPLFLKRQCDRTLGVLSGWYTPREDPAELQRQQDARVLREAALAAESAGASTG